MGSCWLSLVHPWALSIIIDIRECTRITSAHNAMLSKKMAGNKSFFDKVEVLPEPFWLLCRYLVHSYRIDVSLVPRPFPPPVFDWRWERPGNEVNGVTSFGCCRIITVDWIGTASSGKQLQMHTATGRLGWHGTDGTTHDSIELVSFPHYLLCMKTVWETFHYTGVSVMSSKPYTSIYENLRHHLGVQLYTWQYMGCRSKWTGLTDKLNLVV